MEKLPESLKLEIQKINEKEKQIQEGIEESKTTIFENRGKYIVKKIDKETKEESIKEKEYKQFRVSIPKKFVEILKLNKDNFQAKAILDKKTTSIKIEITKI